MAPSQPDLLLSPPENPQDLAGRPPKRAKMAAWDDSIGSTTGMRGVQTSN